MKNRSGWIARMGLATLKYHILNKRTPVNLMLSVTDRCNSSCRYCSVPSRAKPELTTLQIFRLIDEFSAMGGSRIALWGGEPLIRDDIGEIIDHCKSKGLLTSLDTNGYLVPEKIVQMKNLDVLVVSFDGEEINHDMNKEKGSYQKVMNCFKAARGKIPVWTITVLTKYNLGSIDFILDKAEEFGFYTTWQVLHHQSLGSSESRRMFPEQKEYKEAISVLMERKNEGRPIINSMEYLEYLYDWPDYTVSCLADRRRNLSCYAAQLYCNIDTDGRLYPCSVLVDAVPAKNAVETGFKEAFDYVKDIPCRSCSAGCFIEYNYMYSLRPAVIINWLKYLLKR
jgi:MoaA/NifB/PqqE/SkfB family radical SAM enzyme